MNKNNNRNNQITSTLILAVMIVCGASMLVPGYLATRSKLILIFAVIWIGTLLLVMIRTILGIKKQKECSGRYATVLRTTGRIDCTRYNACSTDQ